MSLKVFHFIFITLSLILCAGFGVWSLMNRETGDYYLAMGIVSLLCGVGLLIYGNRFFHRKFWKE